MNKIRRSENGQAIILIVIGLVALLGFAALAIDGGMVYSDRRNAQNGADSAALAGALQKSNLAGNPAIILAAQNSLSGNNFDPSQAHISISDYSDFSGSYTLVTVVMTTTTKTSFVQVFFGGEMRNVVTAVARARKSNPALPGMAIVAMGNCPAIDNGLIEGTGGGNSGGVRTKCGGVFINSAGDNGCALQPPNNGYGIEANPDQLAECSADDTHGFWSVGPIDYSGNSDLSPAPPINTDVNGGQAIGDPLADVPEPQCAPGHPAQVGGIYQPGSYTEIPEGQLASGIYCISGEGNYNGDTLGPEHGGVVLYFSGKGGSSNGFTYPGQGSMNIWAPVHDDCPSGPTTDPTDKCTFMGIAIYAARGNTATFEVRGNGGSHIHGLVYILDGTFQVRGGGCAEDDAVVFGQIIAKKIVTNGGGDVAVKYMAGYTYWQPTKLSLQK